MKTLTIFTPVYNRAYILPKLYKSLCDQKCNDFLWLVVNDGSSDNIDELMTKWMSEGKIEIRYEIQSNGGKMRAHNRGVSLTDTPLFYCIDSDDQITENAVSRIIACYQDIKDNENICGILAKRHIINREVSAIMPDSQVMTMNQLYDTGYRADLAVILKTKIIKEFPFPEIEGEKFITEAYAYDQIDQHYKYLLKDEDWMICEYQADGYTSNALSLYFKHPKGWALYHAQYYRLFAHTFRLKIKTMGYYIAMCKIAKEGFWESFSKSPSRVFYMLSILAGIRFYYRYVNAYSRLK